MRPRLQEFYEETVKHRRLTWYYHSGLATIRGNFKQKPIDMLMSTTQAAVVLLFNSGQHVAFFAFTTHVLHTGLSVWYWLGTPHGKSATQFRPPMGRTWQPHLEEPCAEECAGAVITSDFPNQS